MCFNILCAPAQILCKLCSIIPFEQSQKDTLRLLVFEIHPASSEQYNMFIVFNTNHNTTLYLDTSQHV